MKILVANLGSTSFKYRLFDVDATPERELARGGVERIGSGASRSFVAVGDRQGENVEDVPDHGVALDRCLAHLSDPEIGCLTSASDVAAVGFKAVHGGRITGVRRVDADVLAAMQEVADVAPAHNPPYVAAMRLLGERFPDIPLIAAFETGFHETIPEANRLYAVPWEWAERFGVRRWGFHGASHRYIAERMSELLGRSDARVISCHLGGSSSLCAIHAGRSVATSMGMSPQSGLPQNNRTGDFDPFAIRLVMRATGKSLDEVLEDLAERSGLLGLSGASGDVRDLEAISRKGHERVWRALQVYIASVRHYLGAYFLELGGADAVVFTGGIGENSAFIRESVCSGLEWFGIGIDADRNAKAKGETVITSKESWVKVWTIPTNEELIVARQVKECLNAAESGGA